MLTQLRNLIRENGKTVDDRLHEIFVNTAIDDGSDIADLMSCFEKKEIKSDKFPKLTRRVTELKTTEGGASAVCEEWKNTRKRLFLKKR